MYFVVILAVFVIGYGVAKQAVLYPNMDVWSAIVGVLNRPYWQMYGELFVEDILGKSIFFFPVLQKRFGKQVILLILS